MFEYYKELRELWVTKEKWKKAPLWAKLLYCFAMLAAYIALPLAIFCIAGWVYYNDIHMDPQAWFVLIVGGFLIMVFLGGR